LNGFFFYFGPFSIGQPSRNAYILPCIELGQQVVKLENKTDMPVSKRRQFFSG